MNVENDNELIKKATFRPYKIIFLVLAICIPCIVVSMALIETIRPVALVAALAAFVLYFGLMICPIYLILSGIMTLIKCVKNKSSKKYIIINIITIVLGILSIALSRELYWYGMSV